MSHLQAAVEQYLALRRSLGFELREAEATLNAFVAFAQAEGASFITTNLVLRWTQQPSKIQSATWAARVSMVRCFATWRSATDPRTEIPPERLVPCRYVRTPPYIYSDDEIARLLAVTRKLPSAKGLRGATYATFFALLAASGMRMREALALDQRDVDLGEGVLTIRRTKFRKSRLVPVHPTTRDALEKYAERRAALVGGAGRPAFFVSERGARISQWSTRYTFAKVSSHIGLRAPFKGSQHGHGPRLHDLRHRFAVTTLIDWYRAGVDVEREMPKLAAYLGHTHIHDTYWYIEAVPELLQLAAERLTANRKEGAR